jgi:hypothetical protein
VDITAFEKSNMLTLTFCRRLGQARHADGPPLLPDCRDRGLPELWFFGHHCLLSEIDRMMGGMLAMNRSGAVEGGSVLLDLW